LRIYLKTNITRVVQDIKIARMRRLQFLLCGLLLSGSVTHVTAQQNTRKQQMIALADKTLDFAARQYKLMLQHVPDGVLPRTTNNKDGRLVTAGSDWWTSGFYPGTLWYLYEYTKDSTLKNEALKRTALVEKEKYNTETHDLGFMLYCSYGNAYRITKNPAYKEILLTSARSLCTRFNPKVGCIKSWDHSVWQFPVIIDNMMNLELLEWATRVSKDTFYAHVARTHANTTMRHHFRPDYSSYHVIDYDSTTGAVRKKNTAQGANDTSAWARGQAWGLYGYTMMYRDTKNKAYLAQAQHIADYILGHPRLPADLIPYWDYDAPNIPAAPRDASAGAVAASALLELSRYTKGATAARYWKAGEKMLESLSSPAYLAKEGENNDFILMHSVGHLPQKSEVDVPLTYADYYFVEALLRYKQWAK
jgi:hypothetical protein